MTEPFGRLRRFLRELRRRNVYKVAVAYLAVAFVGIQAARMLVPPTTLPGWADDLLIYLSVFGFPIALVIAWAFEVTPEGVRRTADAAAARTDGEGEETAAGEAQEAFPVSAGVLAGLLVVVALAGGAWWFWRPFAPQQAQAASERSVAVLPFDDLSPAGSSEHLGLGLTESIIAELALVEDLSVVSRTSVMPYRETDLQLPSIADSLGVEHVLEGSISQHGDSVQITAQLIRADRDRHIWTKTYNQEFSDIFRVQSEVARRVAEALEAQLTTEARRRLRDRPTQDPTAYKLYLRARDLTLTDERANVAAAIELFRQAIGLDSTFALAYAGLSRAYETHGDFGVAGEWVDSAEAAARRAVQLDRELAEAHRALGNALYNQGKLTAAERHLKRTVASKPGDGRAFELLASVYHWGGEVDESLRWAWRALPRVPDAYGPRVWIMQALFSFREEAAADAWRERVQAIRGEPILNLKLFHALARGRVDTLRKRVEELRRREPGADRTLQWKGVLAQLDGENEKARELYRRAYRENPGASLWSVALRTRLAQTLRAAGDSGRAEDLLKEVLEQYRSAVDRGGETFVPRVQLASAYAVLGDEERAYRWLDSIPVGVNMRQVPRDPVFRGLHGEERYGEWRQRARRRVTEQRREAMKWARGEGIDWPPMPEDSPVSGG